MPAPPSPTIEFLGCPSPEAAGLSAERLTHLTALFQADTARAAIPGAVVLVVRNGAAAYHQAFGVADPVSGRAMQPDSVFRIASMTKPLTAVAALLLMEQGRLALFDPVSRYLPELRDVAVGVEAGDAATGRRRLTLLPCRRQMTLHDLLRHTAGFTYGQFGDSLVQRAYRSARMMDPEQDNAEMVAKLARLPLSHQPGTTFEYGMSTDVLGRVVEVVSGLTLDRFFAAHITGPLGMPDTAFGMGEDRRRLAQPQIRTPPDPPGAGAYDPARPARWLSGGGGLLSTAPDYARFGQMLLNGGTLGGVRLLGRKSVDLMLQNHLPPGLRFGTHSAELGIAAPLPQLGQGYGLGIGIRTAAGLSPVPGSIGDCFWGGSLGPYFWLDRSERLCAVLMLQELDVEVRTRYRSLLRALVYQALL